MKEFLKVFNKPRGIYFSIITMLTISMILMKVSFSFFVIDSTDTSVLTADKLINVLSIEDNENEITFSPNETKELTLHVKSENDIDSSFIVTYEGESFLLENLSAIKTDIEPFQENSFIIRVTNKLDVDNTIKFNITSGFKGKPIEVNENIIK